MTNFNFDILPAQRTRNVEEPELVSTVVELVNAAPRPLGIKEVIAVLTDAGFEVPTEATVRSYLNRAVADERISKPSRQAYGPAGMESMAEEAGEAEEDSVEEADENLDLDELADD